MAGNVLSNTWAVTRVVLAGLRFLAVFAAAAAVAGYWDDIRNHVDKWTRPAVAPDALAGQADVEYYCPMHPNVVRGEPGQCSICGMPLAKRKKGEKVMLPAGVISRVQLTPQKIAMANVRTSVAGERALARDVRAAAVLDYDETRVAQLSARVAGRADELYVKSVGQKVKRGDKVYSLYSPELYTAQREYLLARKRVNDVPKDAVEEIRHDAIEIYNAAMEKLVLWGMTQADLNALEQAYDTTGKAPTHFVVTSPIEGIVVRKSLFEGGYVNAGDTPYTIVDESNLWLQASIYEEDVALVKLGQQAAVAVESLPGKAFEGKITFLAFQVDPATRTLAARIEVPNEDLALRRGMFAEAMIRVPVLPEPAATGPATRAADTAGMLRARAFRAALEPYFVAQRTLAEDQTTEVAERLKETLEKLAAFKEDAELGRHVEAAGKVLAEAKPADIEGWREVMRNFSAEVIEIGKAAGVPADGETVKIYHCPMGRKPDWLQVTGETINPYMGRKMLGCGEPVEALPRRAAPVPTRPATAGTKLLAVPRSAVIDTGNRKIVFVERSDMAGVFDMRAIETGPLAKGDWYPVLRGLEKGEKVVTNGAFLLDAENRLNPLPTEAATGPATVPAVGPATASAAGRP